MRSTNTILIATIAIAFVCASSVAVGFTYAAALPIAITLPLILVLVLKKSESRSIWLLQFGTISFVLSSLLWPRYAAFFLPGLPLINPQRIANAAVIAIIFAAIITNKYLTNEIRASAKKYAAFWISIAIYIAARTGSVIMSEDKITSIYRFTQEIFVHIIFILLGLHLGARQHNTEKFLKALTFGLIATSILAIIEFTLKKNIFSYFITAQNEYMAWALSEKIRDGVYRAKSTFDHPLTFSEFIAIATPLSIYYTANSKSKLTKTIGTASVIALATSSILLSGSRSGYLAIAITATIVVLSPAIFTIIHKKLTLQKATAWSFLMIVIGLAIAIGASIVYEYTLGAKSYNASDEARVEMVHRSIKLAENSPFYGYGIGLAASKIGIKINPLGDYTVDSIYLTFLVESGAIALIAFIFFTLYATQKSWQNASDPNQKNWQFWNALGTALFSVIVFKTILSLLDNNYLMYILLGIAVSRTSHETTSNDKY